MAISKPHIVRVQIPSNKYGRGRVYRISQISEHHVVGDAQHVINKAQGSAIFSTTFTIAMDGTIYQLVEIGDTPYCDNDYRSNGRSITIEHAGGHPSYPYTEAMYASSIHLHAWLFQEYGMLNCVRHRDIPEIKADPSKATACPGGLDVERIVRDAKARLQQGENMAEKINLNTSRILTHGVLGRNGLKGRDYSLDGNANGHDPWVGGELTNDFLNTIFLSDEARQWRDSQDDNAVSGINRQLERLPVAEAELRSAITQVTDANRVIGEKDTTIKALTDENTSLKAQIGDENLTVKQAIRVLWKTITDAIANK